MKQELQIRKIKLNEIPKVSKLMATCFLDYPLYSVFFKDEKRRFNGIYHFFCVRNYCRQRFTYITEDETAVFTLKRPGDKERPIIGFFLNPISAINFLLHVPLSALWLVRDFNRFSKPLQKKYYDKQKDWYFQVICTKKEARENLYFFKILKEIDEGEAIYAETHTERNAELYKLMGCQLLEEAEWHGIKQYILLRPATDSHQ